MTTCPFCNRDPFHYVDNGVGMEAVAVTCCELGQLLYEREKPKEVTLTGDEFTAIAGKIAEGQWYAQVLHQLWELEPDTQSWVDGKITLEQAEKILGEVFLIVRRTLGEQPEETEVA